MNAGWVTPLLVPSLMGAMLTGAKAIAAREHVTLQTVNVYSAAWIAGGTLFAASVFARKPLLVGCALDVALAACVVSAITDKQSGYIFDVVTIPSLAAILTLTAFAGSGIASTLGMVAGAGVLCLLFLITMGRGLGVGDIKLACCIGASLGARNAVIALGVAFVSGGLCAAYLLLFRKAARGSHLRFAPYLCAGMMAAATQVS